MGVTDLSWIEKLREIASKDPANAVQIMPPPSYLYALLYEGNVKRDVSDDIVLLYKANMKTSTSSLPLDVRDEVSIDLDSTRELGGNPLPAPFEEDEFENSVLEMKHHQWPKAELNHLPLKMIDALNFNNEIQDCSEDCTFPLDVWCLVDGGLGQASNEKEGMNGNKNHSLNGNSLSETELDTSRSTVDLKVKSKSKILIGIQSTENWWTRSFIESQGMCSIASPEMDPLIMKRDHVELAKLPEYKMKVNVICRYSINGQRISPDPALVLSQYENASSVSLELEWEQLSVAVPLQEASTKVLVQVLVGHTSSRAHVLWKQLRVLQDLFDVLLSSWSEKVTPDALPYLEPHLNEENPEPQESLETRLKTLILGGGQALQAQTVNRRMSMAPASMRQSVAPSLLGRKSLATGFLGRMSLAPQAFKDVGDNDKKLVNLSLTDALNFAVSGNRENSDVTDQLWNLLAECKTYRELKQAWDLVFSELHESSVRPFIRPKNNNKAAKLIQAVVTGQVDGAPDFFQIEGGLQPLELLIELGLDKLTADYYSVFLDTFLVGRDELQAPQIVRSGLGVARERWLASCGQTLGWLAQVHSALEVSLPLENTLPPGCFTCITAKALKYYQSKISPVRSVANLMLPGNFLQDFSVEVNTEDVCDLLNEKFDWWRMTLVSESERRKVKSVFLRSYLRPIFPPQLSDYCETLLQTNGIENVQYHCAEATTISMNLS